MRTLLLLSTSLLALTSPTNAEELPKVLLLGDSISIGYTPHVQKLLEDEATVTRPMKPDGKRPENCAYAAFGLTRLDHWLGDTTWDVIHFNFGLHDLKYIGQPLPDAKIVPQRGEAIKANPDARQLSTVDAYVANLEKIVKRLQQTKATLIFCTTTPVPEGSRGRLPGEEVSFNNAAIALMEKHNIAVNDLHRYASQEEVASHQRKADVHYTKEGSQLLAAEVARTIKAQLPKQ
jgi:acyl-CoA thioesterase-1